MGNTFGYGGLTLNTGSYYGSGYSNYSSYGNRVASSTNINRVSRDVAQGYSQDMEVIQAYIQRGDVNQALALYDSLFDEVKQTAQGYGYSLTDGQISSILNKAYQNTTGSSFVNTIDDECHSPFVTGLIEGIPIVGLFSNGNSDAEALAKATGTKVRDVDKFAEGFGAILTNAASYAAIGAVIGNVPGAAVGAVIGTGVAIFKCLTKGKN